MGLSKTASLTAKAIKPVKLCIHNVGIGVLAVMMFLTGVDVILRYVFRNPITGSFELQGFMMAILVAMGIGYCAFEKGHITVDILFNRFPKRTQGILYIFYYFIAACFFALVSWQTVIEGLALQSRHITSSVLLLPIFPFYCLVAFGTAVLCFAFLCNCLESVGEVVNR